MSNQTWWQGWRPEWTVFLMTVGGFLLLPSHSRLEAVRTHSKQLVIQTSRTSPPRVAFQEVIEQAPATKSWIDLAPAGITRVNLNQLIAKDSLLRGLKSIRNRKIVLSPMLISREKALKTIDDQAWLGELPEDQRRRVSRAQAQSGVLEEDWKLPTTRDLLNDKLTEIKSQTPDRSPTTKVTVIGTDADGNSKSLEDFHNEADVRTAPDEPPRDQFLVMGTLGLDNESPLGPDRHLEVNWFEDGIAKQAGQVDIKKGTYAITVPSRSGTVIAQMFDHSGASIASARYSISSHDSPENLQKLSLHVHPDSRVARSFQEFGTPAQSKVARVSRFQKNPSPNVLISATSQETMADEDGILKVDGMAEGSWTFLRTEKKGYYPGVYLANAGDMESLQLFPAKMMKALVQIVRDRRVPGFAGETGAIIWGKVSARASGVEGTTVSIEDLPDAQPIYFYDELLLPNENAKATSKSGYFAFIDVPPGFYSVRVNRGEQLLGTNNVQVEEQSVSPIEIATDLLPEKVSVKVYDAFLADFRTAKIEFQQLPEALTIDGIAPVDLPRADSLSLARITPQDPMYLETIEPVYGANDYFHVPLIRKDWLWSLRSNQKIADQPETGIIVGFVPNDDYEIDLPHVPDFDRSQIVFFDSQGMPSRTGVAGGGFVVFNAPTGSHSVVLLPKKSNVLHTRVMPVDANTVNVLKFEF